MEGTDKITFDSDEYLKEKQRVWDESEKELMLESGMKKKRKKQTHLTPKKKKRK